MTRTRATRHTLKTRTSYERHARVTELPTLRERKAKVTRRTATHVKHDLVHTHPTFLSPRELMPPGEDPRFLLLLPAIAHASWDVLPLQEGGDGHGEVAGCRNGSSPFCHPRPALDVHVSSLKAPAARRANLLRALRKSVHQYCGRLSWCKDFTTPLPLGRAADDSAAKAADA